MKNIILAASLLLALQSGSCQQHSNANDVVVFALPLTDSLPYPVVATFDELAPLFEQYNDTVHVVNFWATWCGPCVEELPWFEQLAREVEGKPVKIYLVSLDFKKDIRTKLLRFVESRPGLPPVIALTDSKTNVWIDRVEPTWGGAIPITILYKNDHRVFVDTQFESYEELRNGVEALLLK
ncbi:MAG: TlpA disulfide reductase family protein [Saprospiraceae bacterium]